MKEEQNGSLALPKNWIWSSIGEVIEPLIEQRAPQGGAEFIYIDISSIDNKKKTIVEPKILPVAEAPSRAKQQLQPGDVLVSMTRPNLNAVACLPENFSSAIGSTGFCVLRTKTLPSAWLYFLVQSNAFVEAMSLLVQGALYPAVRPKDIFSHQIPVAPLAEQLRIVAKIEELFTKLDAGVASLKAAKKQLKRYRQSVLKAAVEGELTREWREKHKEELEPASVLLERILKERHAKWEADQLANMQAQGKAPKDDKWKEKHQKPAALEMKGLPKLPDKWRWINLEIVADAIDPHPSHRTPPEVVGGIPYIGMGDVDDEGNINLSTARKVSHSVYEEHQARYQLKAGDFIFGKIGTLGKPVKLKPPFNYTLSANVVLIQPKDYLIESGFVFTYLASPLVERLLTLGSRATTQAAFGIQKVRIMPFPLAPTMEQEVVTGEVERRLSVADEIEATLDSELKRAERLRQSILKRAFEGKLVPQDPNDEPASVLLERIKAERSSVRSSAFRRSGRAGGTKKKTA